MNIDEIIKNTASTLAVNRSAEEAKPSSNQHTLPNSEVIIQVLTDLKKAIFPGYFDGENLTDSSAEYYEGYLLTEIYRKLKPQIEIALRLPTSEIPPEKQNPEQKRYAQNSLPRFRRSAVC